MSRSSDSVPLTVIIPTYNRAPLLQLCLESLTRQSIGLDALEVMVVDDGSEDSTAAMCAEFTKELQLRHVRIAHRGIAAAKNLGVSQARGSVLLFMDDDDVADRDLCGQHLEMHRRYPEGHFAVLGYATWAPWLAVTEVMHFVTDVGQFLFSYTDLRQEQLLDFTYFWGGLSSCKRAFLIQHGVFDEGFEFGCEDIELAYRLGQAGFKVIFNRNALQHVNRAITFAEFCRRCERQGMSQWMFSQLHEDPTVQRICDVSGAVERWARIRHDLEANVVLVQELEASLEAGSSAGGARSELWQAYGWTFKAFRLKGIIEAMERSAVARS